MEWRIWITWWILLIDELPYSVSDIQNYFEYILKKHGEKTDNPSIKYK